MAYAPIYGPNGKIDTVIVNSLYYGELTFDLSDDFNRDKYIDLVQKLQDNGNDFSVKFLITKDKG